MGYVEGAGEWEEGDEWEEIVGDLEHGGDEVGLALLLVFGRCGLRDTICVLTTSRVPSLGFLRQ